MNFNFSVPSKVIFEKGSSATVPEVINDLQLNNVLFVYDKGIIDAGIADKVIEPVEKAGINVTHFTGVYPNPTIENVEEGYEIAASSDVDAIITIGGGSSMDCAKAINILLTNPGSIKDYEGRGIVKEKTKPLIAIPTTAGTGSEGTAFTIITDTERQRKMIIAGDNVAADIALVDPELTVGLPPAITAATGMDALTHAIEAFVSKNASIPSNIHALKAIELIVENLEEAVKNGSNIEARENMMLGSLLAGIAFNQAGLGLVHAIAHPLGSHFGVAHGVANAIGLPYVVKYNSDLQSVKEKHVEMASAMGFETEYKSLEIISEEIVSTIVKLSNAVDIPSLKEIGINKENLDEMAVDVTKENSMKFTPRDASLEEVKELLNDIYYETPLIEKV
ncbi:iron-containing alcohol dehydrogenase [Salicibibacter kimchii]|uniref:Iron-containing alcohol dehydrogenase n=1 Tax=Salicibibacter kimchii TaxID=2099786 RepID=A0A345C1G3_9BACI|nr:iron-containing alcohol dehydrogenase [Salicibibacter kimchii]AXF57044.1 iron-containing alcohol dehydrogenase [Salicibibacter kimchii]